MTEEISPYSVGALLYCPAYQDSIIRQIAEKRILPPYSVALCLEDSVADTGVEAAEAQLLRTFRELYALTDCYVPKIFIRVRSAVQAVRMYHELGETRQLLTGFIFPKFSMNNADGYQEIIQKLNRTSERPVYMMPILETRDILDVFSRHQVLAVLKAKLDAVRAYVLNVRVGGNDFCNCYGLRRSVRQTIYDIGVIRSALEDIANVFSSEYVVSAPVWEYFADGKDTLWLEGLRRELALDRLNGFVGKTVIHPSQVAAVNESLQPLKNDYLDALHILNWDSNITGVEKSSAGNRMNEVKCHAYWARKVVTLAEFYGVKENT